MKWIVFYDGAGKELAAYTQKDTFAGEKEVTVQLLASEHGIPESEIIIAVEERPDTGPSYDPFFRKDSYQEKPWYDEFQIFCAIGVCEVPDENVKEVREALARFLYASATEKGKVPGITLIYGDGAIDSENMGRYILEIRNG